MQDKYLLLVYNQHSFDYRRANEESPSDVDLIIKESTLMQFPFVLENPRHHRLAVQRTQISFADAQTESRHEEMFFHLDQKPDQNFAPSLN